MSGQSADLFAAFHVCRSLENLQMTRRTSMFFASVNLTEIVMCLEDLINYFVQPEEDMGEHRIYL